MPSLSFTANPEKFSFYSEVSQKSPMQWRVYYKDNDGVLHPQSNWWKCKDFMNDVVFYLATGEVFSVYSFNNEHKVNDDFVYMGLKFIPTNVNFQANLILINQFLKEKGFNPVEIIKSPDTTEAQYLIKIPIEFFKNTFYVSVVTSLIRSCVYKNGTSLNDLLDQEPTLTGYRDKVKKLFVKENSEELNKVLYCNYQYSGDVYQSAYVIHDAGLQSWIDSYSKFKE